jgi:hypothetical protein
MKLKVGDTPRGNARSAGAGPLWQCSLTEGRRAGSVNRVAIRVIKQLQAQYHLRDVEKADEQTRLMEHNESFPGVDRGVAGCRCCSRSVNVVPLTAAG